MSRAGWVAQAVGMSAVNWGWMNDRKNVTSYACMLLMYGSFTYVVAKNEQ